MFSKSEHGNIKHSKFEKKTLLLRWSHKVLWIVQNKHCMDAAKKNQYNVIIFNITDKTWHVWVIISWSNILVQIGRSGSSTPWKWKVLSPENICNESFKFLKKYFYMYLITIFFTFSQLQRLGKCYANKFRFIIKSV